ncbi:ATP synthase delta chain AtpH [Mycobacteroides abscessus subsp. massiliense]|uniref:F0F1 ATP synthase subunit B/delta n=1 Tax=Mycobacteroides abscessus TaxID=36809 RepID=UPI0009A8A720|nr:F0F1 ATP synthase subunit B/delta [Mycobacteroides abscessus]SKD89441.1 ATP synthase delta chain AtpH [Mycobacteroides abscessus subsp. massiliense]SKE01873.1 ATP synthase delta chain AtpH [Mycobacteroides abscessus subsp. massiliense]SKE04026.1 ATP synthase delta chain AtpH [Mycobacteroides abscessus subsp. massiliense]SKE55959.1 ATP synthase delta chain AtpH [Mycobacteroides abscessus subsp. massiliense]SKE56470.1 ATP synthase delta chain AtpH [Mycobacteroides abscessus subsp. massiliense
MSTFIGQLIGFAVIVFLVVKYVVPPVRTLMAKQQDAVRQQLADSKTAADKLVEAEGAHAKAIEDAKADAAQIAEEAKADAVQISKQLREQADAEVERIKVHGQEQIVLQRQQLIRQLRGDLGAESVRRASDLVRSHVADPSAQSATVDRFLDELSQMAGSVGAAKRPVPGGYSGMHAASRESLAAQVSTFRETAASLDSSALSALAEDIAAVAELLISELVLRKHLSEPVDASENEAKLTLVNSLLGNKIGAPSLAIVRSAVTARWSASSDLITSLEYIARLALLERAERDGQIEDVEDQLFRVSRVLDAEPQLATLLSDSTAPAQGRVALLTNVLGGRAIEVTTALLAQTVRLLHSVRAEVAVLDVAELAVARRDESVAHVKAAAPITDAQRTRLAQVLGQIYGRTIAVQLDVDPELLGGLVVNIGDEEIDGSLSTRLSAAALHLPN